MPLPAIGAAIAAVARVAVPVVGRLLSKVGLRQAAKVVGTQGGRMMNKGFVTKGLASLGTKKGLAAAGSKAGSLLNHPAMWAWSGWEVGKALKGKAPRANAQMDQLSQLQQRHYA